MILSDCIHSRGHENSASLLELTTEKTHRELSVPHQSNGERKPARDQPSLDRVRELNAQWTTLKARSLKLLERDIPTVNKCLWDADLAVIWKDTDEIRVIRVQKYFRSGH